MKRDFQGQPGVYISLAVVLFVVLLGRLMQLQILQGDTYFRASEKNRVRNIVLEPPRGLISDRHGEILVANRPSYSVSVVPYEFLKDSITIDLLSEIVALDPADIRRRIKRRQYGNFTPVKIKRQIDLKELSGLEENRLDLPGVFYNVESKRFYPARIRAPHIFGYLGEITSEELSVVADPQYKQGDDVGKNGIELQYERHLRGTSGVQYVEVDVLGREIRDLPELDPEEAEPGNNLVLTLDGNIQRYLEEEMADKKGAAVVLDPRNGEILAITSKPDYDPEIFSGPIPPDVWQSLINNDGNPLYNRACQSVFPPGSTYKLVLAAAGLETGLMNLQRKVTCRGSYRLGRRPFKCWKAEGHGQMDLLGAIEQSCNVYFFVNALEVGLENWAKYSKIFQFGSKTRIDLPNESAGLVPDATYFDKKYGERGWTRGQLLNLSIGQGDLLTTPLQMAYFAMIIGNSGVAYRPRLVKKATDPLSGEIIATLPDSLTIEGISEETFTIIKEGMYRVVNGAHGTAKVARLPGIEVCGKTGTAQNPHGESHAWFIGFAPRENPQIAICVFVENGGGGGANAAPIAKGVLTRYFDNPMASLN